MPSTESRVSADVGPSISASSSESTPSSEPESSLRSKLTPSLKSSQSQKATASPDGSSTDRETTRKARISRWPPTFSIPSSERTSRDSSRSDQTEVSDTSGDSRSEVNIPKPPVEEEEPSVSKGESIDLVIRFLHYILFLFSSYFVH